MSSSNQIKTRIHESIRVEYNPIVIQLQEFGFNKIYSRRVFYYLHPDDIDEALNYMAKEKGIIQHRFVKDKRNKGNKMCYICDESEEIHMKELNYSLNSSIKEIPIKINEEKNLNEIKEENEENDEKKSEINVITNQIKNKVNNDINNNNNKNNDNNDKSSNKTNSLESSINYNNNKELETNEENNDIKTNNSIENSIRTISTKKNDTNNLETEAKILFNKEKEKDKEKLEIIKTKIKLKPKEEEKKECEICNEIFIVNEFNQLEKCGHAYCSSCWYDSLSVKIKENKLASIKCLDYNCEEKLPDFFIENILKTDNTLLKIYQRYKLELEIINDPNKKLCPYPNCDSYLEQKNIHNKDVTCLNNHTFCFLCLKKPHGNLPCNGSDLDKSVVDYALNNFVKKCPKCKIIIEKNNGCNHITCTKCGYQWCWLCNEQYNENHYQEGKCKGFQFYQPKNEYDIRLALEGKIKMDELSNSQRQFEDHIDLRNLDDIDEMPHPPIRVFIDDFAQFVQNDEMRYRNTSCKQKFGKTFVFLIFGNLLFNLLSFHGDGCCVVSPVYFMFFIAYFFQLIFLNIISFVLILIFIGFKTFILQFSRLNDIYLRKVNAILFSILFLAFCISYEYGKEKINYFRTEQMKILLFSPYFLLTNICFFPYFIIANIVGMIYIIIGSRDISSLESKLDIS